MLGMFGLRHGVVAQDGLHDGAFGLRHDAATLRGLRATVGITALIARRSLVALAGVRRK